MRICCRISRNTSGPTSSQMQIDRWYDACVLCACFGLLEVEVTCILCVGVTTETTNREIGTDSLLIIFQVARASPLPLQKGCHLH